MGLPTKLLKKNSKVCVFSKLKYVQVITNKGQRYFLKKKLDVAQFIPMYYIAFQIAPFG